MKWYWLGLPGPTLSAIAAAVAFGLTGPLANTVRFDPIPLHWWLLAVFLIPAIYLAGILLTSIFTGSKQGRIFHPPRRGWVVLVLSQTYVVLAEEPGWRGFALPLLLNLFGAIAGTIILGAMWAAWHWPMFQVPTSNQKGAFWRYAVTMVAWSFIMTVLVVHNNGNILPAMAFHAAANASYFVMEVPEQAEKTILVILVLVALALLVLAPAA